MVNTKEEMELLVEEAANELFIYDSSYPEELAHARENWNHLMDVIEKEHPEIDWRYYLPHFNCEGEKIW